MGNSSSVYGGAVDNSGGAPFLKCNFSGNSAGYGGTNLQLGLQQPYIRKTSRFRIMQPHSVGRMYSIEECDVSLSNVNFYRNFAGSMAVACLMPEILFHGWRSIF